MKVVVDNVIKGQACIIRCVHSHCRFKGGIPEKLSFELLDGMLGFIPKVCPKPFVRYLAVVYEDLAFLTE